MRGLKLKKVVLIVLLLVASFTDAWIETCEDVVISGLSIVASFTDAWIETSTIAVLTVVTSVASFTDAWIETLVAFFVVMKVCRIFYRCVD